MSWAVENSGPGLLVVKVEDQAERGRRRDGGQGGAGALRVEDGEPVAQGGDEQAQSGDAVAGDHHGREHRVTREARGLVAAVRHQGDDEGHLDDRDGDGEDEGTEGFADPVRDHLGVVDGGQHRSRSRPQVKTRRITAGTTAVHCARSDRSRTITQRSSQAWAGPAFRWSPKQSGRGTRPCAPHPSREWWSLPLR